MASISIRVDEANKLMQSGHKYLKTGLLKWSPDYHTAANQFNQAAMAYKGAGMHKQAIDANELAIKAYLQTQGSDFQAAKCMEQAALSSKELNDFQSVSRYYNRAIDIYRHIDMSAIKQMSKNINWYPGHMFSGMKAMMGKLSHVDCVVEIHDARLPLMGRNDELKRRLGTIKPHILVLNKCDLADLTRWDKIEDQLRKNGDFNILKTTLTGRSFDHGQRGYDKLAQLIVDSIIRSDRHNRDESQDFKTMIVGIPNVGKSTLINRLRQLHLGRGGEPAKVGPTAGVTKHVMQKIKICSRPPIYVYDTPGVLQPGTTRSYDRAMKLAMCSTISDKAINMVDMARFIFNWMKEQNMDSYTAVMGLESPVENFDELIISSAKSLEKIQTIRDRFTGQERRVADLDSIASLFVNSFRKGAFGRVIIED